MGSDSQAFHCAWPIMAKGVPLALVLLMLTATLSGCLEARTLPKKLTFQHTPTKLMHRKPLSTNCIVFPCRIELCIFSKSTPLQDEVVNLSVDLASANQNIAVLEIEKSDLEAQLASADQENENGTNEIAQLESLIDSLTIP